MLTRDEAEQVVARVLEASNANEARIGIGSSERTHLRFANNMPTTSGYDEDQSLWVKSTFGNKSGAATVNQLDGASIRKVVARSEELARLAPDDPEHMPVLQPQSYSEIAAFHDSVPQRGAEDMARGSATCIADASKRKLVAAGYSQADATAGCFATSKGLFGYRRSTDVSFSETVRTKDGRGSGWAAAVGNRMQDIDYRAAAITAGDKSVRSVGPKPLDPGKYVTILEPACVTELLWALARSLSARRADEGRSYFATKGGGNRIGEKIFGDDIHIHSDPNDARTPGSPWGSDGVPQTRRDWIAGGVLQNLVYSRFWAQRQQKEAPVPGPPNLIMKGGAGTLAELIASTDKGLLITSLWYIRSVDPKSMLFTGLTRDGVFWIEKGKIAHPVTNFRWNESPIRVLKNIDAMTTSSLAAGRSSRPAVVPALRVREFELSSVSDAV